jgi:hypothetical protein
MAKKGFTEPTHNGTHKHNSSIDHGATAAAWRRVLNWILRNNGLIIMADLEIEIKDNKVEYKKFPVTPEVYADIAVCFAYWEAHLADLKKNFSMLRLLLEDLKIAGIEGDGLVVKDIESLKDRLTAILAPREPVQGEFFPLFKPQKSVELKKEFALNFGSMDRIEKDYKHLLNEKLSSGLTLLLCNN